MDQTLLRNDNDFSGLVAPALNATEVEVAPTLDGGVPLTDLAAEAATVAEEALEVEELLEQGHNGVSLSTES